MTQDEIIAMAKEAGGYESPQYPENLIMDEHDLGRFAALIAAKEREAIAAHYDAQPHMEFFGKELADDIRARGAKEGA